MPFLASLVGALLSIAGSMVGRVLLSLGIGYVTYKGFDVSVQFLMNMIKDNMSQMPKDISDMLAWFWVDKAIGMVFSAWLASLAVSGLAKGVTKMKVTGK